MKTNRAVRYRLHPKPAKARLMAGTAGACRFVWNWWVGRLKAEYEASEESYIRARLDDPGFYWREAVAYHAEIESARAKHRAREAAAIAAGKEAPKFKAPKKPESLRKPKCGYRFYSANDPFTALRRAEDTAWLQEYSRNNVFCVLKKVEVAYKNFFNGAGGLPRFHGKHTTAPSFPLFAKAAFDISGRWLKIQRIGWIRFSGHNPYPDGKPVSGTVKKEAGRWYAYIVYEVDVAENENTGPVVAIDRNVGQVAVGSGKDDCRIIPLPDVARHERRYKRYQRQLARQVKGSRRRAKTKTHMQRVAEKIRHTRHDWAHQTTRAIADAYGMAVIEDLNTKAMTASAKGTADNPGKNVKAKAGLNRGVLGSVWGKFEQLLAYKMPTEKTPAPYTSQRCAECGHTEPGNRPSQSVFKCLSCGHTDNADINAVLNILAAHAAKAATGKVVVRRGVAGQSDRTVKRRKPTQLRLVA